jgi:virulence factor Mce-like protein
MAVTASVVAVWLAFGGTNPFERPFQLRAVVQSGSELHSRTPVRIAGVDVGKVKRVERGPGATAIVTMSVDRAGLPIHRDATIKVRPRIFLEGNFYLELRPGTPAAPEMRSGDTIPLGQTAIPVQLDQILTTLDQSSRGNLTSVVHGLADALKEGGAKEVGSSLPAWEDALARGSQGMEALRGLEEHDLSQALVGLDRTTAALADRDDELAATVSSLYRTTAALASRREQLARAVPELDGALREADPTLAALDRLIPPARSVVAEARPGVRELPGALRLANPLLTQLERLVTPNELPRLVRDGGPAIRSVARLQPHLRDLLALVRPVTECLRRNVVPTLTAKLDDPPFTDRLKMPVYRELLGAIVGQAGASQNFDGDGPALRYMAGFGDETFSTGEVPGVGESLVGASSEPILGSRPPYTGQVPPFRPDVPCVSQRPPDLRAEAGPAFGPPPAAATGGGRR